MLTPIQRQLLHAYMQATIQAGAIDTRRLIDLTIQALSQHIPAINRHHAAGMLSALKRSGFTITIIVPAKHSLISM